MTDNSMPDLKPCPFCGSNVVFEQEEIFCSCGISMPQGGLELNEEFYKRWNTRVQLSTYKERLEGLKISNPLAMSDEHGAFIKNRVIDDALNLLTELFGEVLCT